METFFYTLGNLREISRINFIKEEMGTSFHLCVLKSQFFITYLSTISEALTRTKMKAGHTIFPWTKYKRGRVEHTWASMYLFTKYEKAVCLVLRGTSLEIVKSHHCWKSFSLHVPARKKGMRDERLREKKERQFILPV